MATNASGVALGSDLPASIEDGSSLAVFVDESILQKRMRRVKHSTHFLEVRTRFELVNEGFADLCLTTWPPNHNKKPFAELLFLERLTRLELATSTLARWRSTR